MLEATRQSIGGLLARIRLRSARDKVISFTRSLTDAQTALVILPRDHGNDAALLTFVSAIRDRFRKENLTFVVAHGQSLPTSVTSGAHVIHLADRDVSYFCLPKAELLRRLKRREYDVAIDLNLDFELPSGYICRESNARVRLGFAHRHADIFYNLQIQADRERTMPKVYDRMAKCLQMSQAGDRS
jgi:ADP-heptose:LPS heptosyltransferase